MFTFSVFLYIHHQTCLRHRMNMSKYAINGIIAPQDRRFGYFDIGCCFPPLNVKWDATWREYFFDLVDWAIYYWRNVYAHRMNKCPFILNVFIDSFLTPRRVKRVWVKRVWLQLSVCWLVVRRKENTLCWVGPHWEWIILVFLHIMNRTLFVVI